MMARGSSVTPAFLRWDLPGVGPGSTVLGRNFQPEASLGQLGARHPELPSAVAVARLQLRRAVGAGEGAEPRVGAKFQAVVKLGLEH